MPSKKLYMESIEAGYLKEFTAEVTGIDEKSVTGSHTFLKIGSP